MKELVETIARALVDHPEKVVVTEENNGKGVYIHLSVDPSDVGKVIGKSGRVANAIRAVVKAAGVRDNVHTVVDIE